MGERVGRFGQMVVRIVIELGLMSQWIRNAAQTKLRVVGVDRVFVEGIMDRRQTIEPVVEKLRRVQPRVGHRDFMILPVELFQSGHTLQNTKKSERNDP